MKGKRYQKQEKKELDIKIVVTLLTILIAILYILNTFYNKEKEPLVATMSEHKTSEEEREEKIIETIETIEKIEEPTEDEKIKELMQEIQMENSLNEDNFAFFYYNIEQQSYYFYNEDTYFTAASTIKMPIAMLYYDKIQDGELAIDDTIVYTSGCYEAGAGTTIYTYSTGSRVPIEFLLEQSIVNSDNTATNILIKNLGYTNCKKQIANYSNVEMVKDFFSSNIISAEYAYNVVNYLYENMQNYEELISYLKQSSNGEYLKKYISDYDVAHKYGKYNGYVHDYGIVFGQDTYLIGVFTKNVSNADELIAKISLDVLNINEKD